MAGRLFQSIVLICSYVLATSSAQLIVETSNGQIVGTTGLTRLNRTYHSFKGIPYAAPPVGQLRFEAPEPAANWTGVLETKNFKSSCAQSGSGNEDCLYLNVHSPKYGDGFSTEPLPVLFYVHGGFFQGGAGTAPPGYFLDEDCLLVAVNYRLHSLGFLNTGDGLIKGNMGMKDLTMALQWVQQNIAKFGGDPRRVTVFGQSAGGAAVHYLMLSPLTKGLINKVISQSGVATKLWSIQAEPAASAKLLAERLKCPTNDPAAMVTCLKQADAGEISRLSSMSGGAVKHDLEVFCPSVEVVNDAGAFLAKHPYDVIADGEAHRIPWISGSCSGEGLLYIYPINDNQNLIKDINENWPVKAPEYLYYNRSSEFMTELVTQFYLGDGPIDFKQQLQNFTWLWSDRLYISFARNTAVMQAKFSPVYLYLFDYKNNENNFAANHGEELFLFFPGDIPPGSKHYNMSRDMVKLWVHFATDDSGLDFQDSMWEPIDVSGRNPIKYMYFSNQYNAFVEDPLKDRMGFWDALNLYRVEPRDSGN